MLSNEDKYQVTLNAITEILGTKSHRNEDEANVLRRVKGVLLECHPEINWWWQDEGLLAKWGKSFAGVFAKTEGRE